MLPGAPSAFSVVETNAFKQLTHLSFATRAGTDASVKRYLASRMAHVQAQLRQSGERAAAAERDLADARRGAATAAAAAADSAAAAAARDAAARATAAAEAADARRASDAAAAELRAREVTLAAANAALEASGR